MKISFSPYQLKPRAGQGEWRDARNGALLRFDFGQSVGFADLHPWPELGDLNLDEQLRGLAAGHLTALTRRSGEFARADARARLAGISLFADLEIPRSHFLIPDLGSIEASNGERQVRALVDEGFDRFKIKMDWDLDRHLPRLHALNAMLAGGGVKLRIDFNEKLKLSDLEYFFSSLDAAELDRLDYLEDPTPFDAAEWTQLSEIHRARFALDRGSSGVLDGLLKAPQLQGDAVLSERANAIAGPLGFDVWVVKPATEDAKLILHSAAHHMERVTFTSYLDHPVGQCFAAWEAAQAMRDHPLLVDSCGLLSQRCYETNEFSERLSARGPEFSVPGGTGCGFDELLAVLPWKKLEL